MPSVPLRALVSPKSGGFAALTALLETISAKLRIVDPSGKILLGGSSSDDSDSDYRAGSAPKKRHLALSTVRPPPPLHSPSC